MGSVEKDTLRLLGELQESAEKAKEGDTAEKVIYEIVLQSPSAVDFVSDYSKNCSKGV